MSRRGWLVGVNVPGYLSEETPSVHPNFAEAFLELQLELVRTRESSYPNSAKSADEELQRAADEASAQVARDGDQGRVEVLAFGLVHWAEQA